ncbi:MAG: phasin family protein [Betaproteobacteria bacterium]
MLKKAKAELGAKPVDQAKELSQSVRSSSHQIWLAGLGAFARAQAEGKQVFENLVQQGERLESRTRQAASETASAARSAAEAKAREMQKMAGGTWDKLEKVFEDRVARALSKLGVYRQNDVEQLAQRVDALAEAVNKLIKSPAKAPETTRRAVKRANAKAGDQTETAAAGNKRAKAADKRARPAAKATKRAMP